MRQLQNDRHGNEDWPPLKLTVAFATAISAAAIFFSLWGSLG